MNDPYLDLLESARKYLMQQQDLFGDTVMREAASGRKSPGRAAPPADGNAFRYPDEPWTAAASLGDLNGQIRSCLKCGLGPTRTNFVFGVGNPQSPVMFVGEAPGADEDAQGEPFVGRAGQLLNKIIEAVGMKREEVYICNILKCRPPNNRDPLPSEMELCSPYLVKQIELIRLRNTHPAFSGEVQVDVPAESRVQMLWRQQEHWIMLHSDLSVPSASITGSGIHPITISDAARF